MPGYHFKDSVRLITTPLNHLDGLRNLKANGKVCKLCCLIYTCREIGCSCKRSIKRSGVTVLRFKVYSIFLVICFSTGVPW